MEANNTKIIRDALVKIHDLTNALDEECGVDPVEVRDIASAALSTTPRNCDLYNDVEDSWQDYKQFHSKKGEAIYFDMMHFWTFARWLFAPAEERKGESDGR